VAGSPSQIADDKEEEERHEIFIEALCYRATRPMNSNELRLFISQALAQSRLVPAVFGDETGGESEMYARAVEKREPSGCGVVL